MIVIYAKSLGFFTTTVRFRFTNGATSILFLPEGPIFVRRDAHSSL